MCCLGGVSEWGLCGGVLEGWDGEDGRRGGRYSFAKTPLKAAQAPLAAASASQGVLRIIGRLVLLGGGWGKAVKFGGLRRSGFNYSAPGIFIHMLEIRSDLFLYCLIMLKTLLTLPSSYAGGFVVTWVSRNFPPKRHHFHIPFSSERIDFAITPR